MGEEEDALSSAALVTMPTELRLLITFLAQDARPSVVFALPDQAASLQTTAAHASSVYSNDAFRALPNADEEAASLQAVLSKNKDRDLNGDGCAKGKWQASITGEYFVVVESNAHPREENGLDGSSDSAPEHHLHEGDAPRDWTRGPIPGMSPWIEFIRAWDWSATALGPMESWSPVLRANMRSMMANPSPRLIVWGEDSTFVYNEATVPFWGKRHPECLGAHISKPWGEAWPYVKPMLDEVFQGKVGQQKGYPFFIDRHGFLEETYWDFSLLPILDLDGKVIGVFDELTEATAAVTGERRRDTVRNLSKNMDLATTLSELWAAVLQSLEAAHCDIPYAMLYSVVDAVQGPVELPSAGIAKKCVLVGTVGLPEHQLQSHTDFLLTPAALAEDGLARHCFQASQKRQPVALRAEDGSLPANLAVPIDGRGFGDTVTKALVSPIRLTVSVDVLGILVIGLNPRAEFFDEYELFVHLLLDFIEKAAALISLPEEQRRVQKISDDIHHALTQQLRLTTLQAERSEAKFTRLAATAPTGMFMFDADGKALYVNDTYLEMLSLTKDEAMSKRPDPRCWEDIVHEDDLQRFVASWQRITDDKVPSTLEYRLKKPWKSIDRNTGQEISGQSWLLATAFPEIEANGSVTTVQGWLTDISHKKFTENLLAQRLEDALENKRQTENFIDLTSHEMRNPLSAILQSADSIVSTLTSSSDMPTFSEITALSKETAEDIVDAAQTIILCAQHQKRIVDDILTLSKLDASLLVISPDKVQIPPLIVKALKMYEAEIERADIETQLVVEPTYIELGVDWVILDPSRLLQVIINLLTNSVKFTQHSQTRKITICLGASRQAPTGKHHGVSFAKPSRYRPQRTSSLAERSGGEDIFLQIAVYDTGRGLTEEELALLFQRFQQASPKTYSQYGGSGLGLFISRQLCELQGGQIGANSGGGKTVFTFYVKTKRWDPNHEGSITDAEVARLPLRRYPSFTSTAASPIAYGRRGSTVLDGVSDGQRNGDAVPQRATSVTRSPRIAAKTHKDVIAPATKNPDIHVLIVEDNLINQKVMSQQLRRAGCIVHGASHGGECLDFLEKSVFCSAETQLSIVLLDLEMPTMDGLTCIRHIRDRQQKGRIIRHVPVIAVTANARSEQITMAIEAGMDQVVTKPFRIPELIPQMERLIAEVTQQAKLGLSIINGSESERPR